MQGILNRRYLRVKAFQALYAYDAKNDNQKIGEKHMLDSVQEIEALYLYMLDLITQIAEMARRNVEQNKSKRLPTEDDLNPNLKFLNNSAIRQLENNRDFLRRAEKNQVNWSAERDTIWNLWRTIRESEMYVKYMTSGEDSFEEDRKFVINLFVKYLAEFEVFHSYLEDQSIYWYDDLSLVCVNVVKTLEGMKEGKGEDDIILQPLFKAEQEDLKFVSDLLKRTIDNDMDFEDMIDENTKNWELDRIARLDIIIMKMAICEFLHFPSIPVKVTMNEYIEMAKNYSTPNSRMFVNGVLDKMLAKLKKENKIQKTGRGLVD